MNLISLTDIFSSWFANVHKKLTDIYQKFEIFSYKICHFRKTKSFLKLVQIVTRVYVYSKKLYAIDFRLKDQNNQLSRAKGLSRKNIALITKHIY